ncbi:MAG: hypothetical protein ABEJ27_01130 [Halodesulfurarchaeum sp.]
MAKRQLEGEYEARISGQFRGDIVDAEFEGVLDGMFEGAAEMDTEMSRGERIQGQRSFSEEDVKGYFEQGQFKGALDGVIMGGLSGNFDGEMKPL